MMKSELDDLKFKSQEKEDDHAATQRVIRIISQSSFIGHSAPKVSNALDILMDIKVAIVEEIDQIDQLLSQQEEGKDENSETEAG